MADSSTAGQLSESLEDYLEAILEIEGDKRVARPKDIARRLGVSPSSVTAALQNLAARALVNYAPYEIVTLTKGGARLAREVRRRHHALFRFFRDFLQLDSKEANELACRMEHQLSARALERLMKLMDFIESCPYSGARETFMSGAMSGPDTSDAGEDGKEDDLVPPPPADRGWCR